MQDFRKLEVWQEAQELAASVYGATSELRGSDASFLRSQLRRASQSIGAIIAEGADSDSPRRFAHYLQMAIGSASEVESHLDFVGRRQLLPNAVVSSLTADTVRLRRRTIALRKRVLDAVSSSGRAHPQPTPTTRTRD